MFLLFGIAFGSFILGFVPEPLEILIFGVGLILLTIGLRWLLKRGEKGADGEIIHKTK